MTTPIILKDYADSRQPDVISVGKGYRLNFNHMTIPAGEDTAEQFVCDFVPQYWQNEVLTESKESFRPRLEEIGIEEDVINEILK